MLLLYDYLQLFDFDVRPLWVDDSTLTVSKKRPPFIFLNNSVEIQPI